MHSYIIQYPSMYPNDGSSQRQIIANNNLVKSVLIDDEGCEKNKKQDKKVFASKVVSLRLVSHPKEKITTDVQARISGATSGGCTSKVNNYEEGMEAKASCFIVSLS